MSEVMFMEKVARRKDKPFGRNPGNQAPPQPPVVRPKMILEFHLRSGEKILGRVARVTKYEIVLENGVIIWKHAVDYARVMGE